MDDDVRQSSTDRYAVSQAYRWKAERDQARQELKEVQERLMPEGIEWPKYDTGEPVQLTHEPPDSWQRIELDADYCEAAKKRVSDALAERERGE